MRGWDAILGVALAGGWLVGSAAGQMPSLPVAIPFSEAPPEQPPVVRVAQNTPVATLSPALVGSASAAPYNGVASPYPGTGYSDAGPVFAGPMAGPLAAAGSAPLILQPGAPPAASYGLSGPPMSNPAMEPTVIPGGDVVFGSDPWTLQLLPNGVMYHSYMAGNREPRMSDTVYYESKSGLWLEDATLGGRVGLLRYGTENDAWPEGWEIDMEGAAFPRLNFNTLDLLTTDFRAGCPITFREGPWEAKIGYFHYCSHLSDLSILDGLYTQRKEYVRDSIVAAAAWRPIRPVRLYAETSWAFNCVGDAEPWEFQFGAEYGPDAPTGFSGAPFAAINVLLRQEVNYSGSLSLQGGWAWRGKTGQTFRVGALYFNGLSDQAQFYDTFEERLGVGIWYDF